MKAKLKNSQRKLKICKDPTTANNLLFARRKNSVSMFPLLMYLNDAGFDEFLNFGGYLWVLQMAEKNKEKISD